MNPPKESGIPYSCPFTVFSTEDCVNHSPLLSFMVFFLLTVSGIYPATTASSKIWTVICGILYCIPGMMFWTSANTPYVCGILCEVPSVNIYLVFLYFTVLGVCNTELL
jgi:hypothetical protein